MFKTIKVSDPDESREYRILAVNLSQVSSVKLGTPDEGTKYITYSLSEVQMSDGSVFEFDQEDERNHDFLSETVGILWEQYYKAIPATDIG